MAQIADPYRAAAKEAPGRGARHPPCGTARIQNGTHDRQRGEKGLSTKAPLPPDDDHFDLAIDEAIFEEVTKSASQPVAKQRRPLGSHEVAANRHLGTSMRRDRLWQGRRLNSEQTRFVASELA